MWQSEKIKCDKICNPAESLTHLVATGQKGVSSNRPRLKRYPDALCQPARLITRRRRGPDTFSYLSSTGIKSLCYIITILMEDTVTSLYAFSAVARLGIAGVLLVLLWGLISWAVALA